MLLLECCASHIGLLLGTNYGISRTTNSSHALNPETGKDTPQIISLPKKKIHGVVQVKKVMHYLMSRLSLLVCIFRLTDQWPGCDHNIGRHPSVELLFLITVRRIFIPCHRWSQPTSSFWPQMNQKQDEWAMTPISQLFFLSTIKHIFSQSDSCHEPIISSNHQMHQA